MNEREEITKRQNIVQDHPLVIEAKKMAETILKQQKDMPLDKEKEGFWLSYTLLLFTLAVVEASKTNKSILIRDLRTVIRNFPNKPQGAE